MSIDLTKLAGQGRAYSGARAWMPEELDALLLLERERGITRLSAADFVRNGIMTLEGYDKAVADGFEPKTQDDAQAAAEAALKAHPYADAPTAADTAAPGKKAKKPAKKKAAAGDNA